MRRVVVDMQNTLFSDAVAASLECCDSDLEVVKSESPNETTELCRDVVSNILVMEVTARDACSFDRRMSIRDDVKSVLPDCKVVLLVDENGEKNITRQVCQAKRDRLIDGFLYTSVSSAYLSAVIDTL